MESENSTEHFIKVAQDMPACLQLKIEETSWEKVSVTKTGYTFYTLRNQSSSKGRQVLLATGVIPCSVEKVVRPIFEDLELAPQWSPRIKACKIVKRLDPCTFISHQISKGTAGIISERDFVVLRRLVPIKDSNDIMKSCILAMKSVTLPEYPENSGIVRADCGLSGWLLSEQVNGSTNFQCAVDIDPKLSAWMPQRIYENRLTVELSQSFEALTDFLSK